MGLGLPPIFVVVKMSSQTQLFHKYINTPKYLCYMSVLFLIFSITNIHHIDITKYY